MNNNKIFLKEETVNEIQLNDLYSAASKVEQQVISLAEMAVKFSNQEVKQKALALKSIANEFSDLLSGIITGTNEQEQPTNLEQIPNEKENLDAPQPQEQRVESKTIISTLKKLIESIDLEEDELIDKTPNEEEEKEILLDDEVPKENGETTENENNIDLSSIFQSVVNGLEAEKVNEVKEGIISVLSSKEGLEDLIQEFESVVDVETLNFALTSLYDYADENEIEIVTI